VKAWLEFGSLENSERRSIDEQLDQERSTPGERWRSVEWQSARPVLNFEMQTVSTRMECFVNRELC
jgi:hypothetical protein